MALRKGCAVGDPDRYLNDMDFGRESCLQWCAAEFQGLLRSRDLLAFGPGLFRSDKKSRRGFPVSPGRCFQIQSLMAP